MVMLRMRNSAPAVEWPPTRTIPPSVYNAFTQNGAMPVSSCDYHVQRYSGTTARVSIWTQQMLGHLVEFHRVGRKIGAYSLYEETCLRDAFMVYGIFGTSSAVIGSESPEVEAIAFSQRPMEEVIRWRDRLWRPTIMPNRASNIVTTRW
jgi:hypothetical protein